MYLRLKNRLIVSVWVFVGCLSLIGLPGCIGFCGGAPSQAEVDVYPTDASNGAPIRSVSYTEQGTTVDGYCQDPSTPDSTVCMTEVLLVDPGPHVITVSAPGYAPQTITVAVQAGQSVHQAVQLTATP